MKIVGMAQIHNEIRTGYLKRCLEHYSSSSLEKLMNKICNYMRLEVTRDYLSVLNGVKLGEVDYNWFTEHNMPDKELCLNLERLHEEVRQVVKLERKKLLRTQKRFV